MEKRLHSLIAIHPIYPDTYIQYKYKICNTDPPHQLGFCHISVTTYENPTPFRGRTEWDIKEKYQHALLVAVPLQRKFATYIYTYVHTRFGDSLVVRSGYELAALVEEGHGVAGLQVVVVFLAHLARPRVPLINLIHTQRNATQPKVKSVNPSARHL